MKCICSNPPNPFPSSLTHKHICTHIYTYIGCVTHSRNSRNLVVVVNPCVRGTPPVVGADTGGLWTRENCPPGKCDLLSHRVTQCPTLRDTGHSDTWTSMWRNTWLLHTDRAYPLCISRRHSIGTPDFGQ